MLSLLTEEVGEESFGVRKRNDSSSTRRVEVEKRGNGSGTSYHDEKKNVGSGWLESNSKCEFESVRAESREEDCRQNENKENYLRGEKHRLRKEGSSCSSYYSCCSLGEFESDTDVQARQEGYGGESRSGFKRNSVESGEVTYEGEIVENVKRHGDVAGRHGVVMRQENTPVGLYAESSGVECDWRKKSEKKLTEVSSEQMESREESLQKHARLSEVHKTGYRKASSSNKQFDDKEEKSSLAVCIDGGTRQRYSQKGDQIAGQSESRMKYKLSTGMQHIHGSDIEAISSSEKWFSGTEENLSAAGSLVQETKQERTKTAGLISRKDDHRINSQQLNEVSEIQEIKVKGTSSSRGQSEARVKNQEDESTLTSSTVQNKEEQIHLTGRWDSRQMDSGKKSLQLTEISGMHHTHIDNSSASLRQSDTRMKNQEDNSNLVFGSFAEIDEQQFRTGKKAIRRVESRKGSQDVSNISVVHNRDTQVSNTKMASDAVHTHADLNTLALQHRTYGEARRGGTYEEPLNLISQENALGSDARLQKSSMHFVGEFVEKVTHDFLTSRIQKENRVSETELVNEGHEHQLKILSQYGSGDFKSKEPDSRRLSQSSGVKGPSDEIWDVTDPSTQEPAQTEVIESTSPTANTVAKRTGRSLWNFISEIVQLWWASHSESHSSTRKSGGRSLPNQSASSEAWFSGHEPDESKDEIIKREKKGISQDSKSADQKHSVTIPIHSQGEGSSSVNSKYKIGHLGGDTLSSSSSSVSKGISSLSSEENFGRHETGKKHVSTSNTATVESSVEMPSLRIRRSPCVYEIPEAGNADVSASGLTQISGTGKDGELKQRKILRNNKILKDRSDEWEEAYKLESEQRKIDEIFMREALVEAKKAADIWEVPVGAVLVQHGKTIARGCNLVGELHDATAHAEMICIREASNLLHTWRLSETTLYVTLEPCPMCAGVILQARIDTVVWGAPNKLLGADGSWVRLFPNGGEGGNGLESSDEPPAPVHPFHPNITTRRGVLSAECAD